MLNSPDYFDDHNDGWSPFSNDEDEGGDRCFCCGGRRVDAATDTNDGHLAVCAGCASSTLLALVLRAIAAGVQRRGATEVEHMRVINELRWRYRYAAGLPDENGLVALLERGKLRREQGNG